MTAARIRHLSPPTPEAPAVLPPPSTEKEWRWLWRSASATELHRFGLRRFSDTPTGTIWLFPTAWYELLPEGLAIILSDGTRCRFDPLLMPMRDSLGVLDFGLFRWMKHRTK